MTTSQSVPSSFRTRVDAAPAAPAIVDDETLTYAALDRASNRIAHALGAALPHQSSPRIGMLLDHGASAVAAMLGILKAGGVYVPLDPSYPAARTTSVLDDVEPALLLTSAARADQAGTLAAGRFPVLTIDDMHSGVDTDPGISIDPDSPAYILYTSGSSGRPKGVIQTHRNAVHFAETLGRHVSLRPGDRVSLLFSLSFGASILNMFSTLLSGATLYPYDVRRRGPVGLPAWIGEREVTVYHSVPTLLRHVTQTLEQPGQLASVRAVILAGEPLYRRDLESFRRRFAPSTAFVNQLGCTEASIIAIQTVAPDATTDGEYVPVGLPGDGMRVTIVDEDNRAVPAGTIGELLVTSRYLSPGYWRQPERTAAAFSATADGSADRTYRTGDLGRVLDDGRLVHLGRRDSRIKLRGFTIEAAEIESALLAHGSLKEAVVVAQEVQPGVTYLVAYVVSAAPAPPTVTDLRNAVAERLPDFMVPARIIFLPELPLTPSGKLNRAALPAPETGRPTRAPYVEPKRLIDIQLAEIWTELLNVHPIGIHDDFFELGGHSLVAARLLARIEERFGWKAQPSVLLTAPTIEQLSNYLLEMRDPAILLCARVGSPARTPLFFLHGDLYLGGFYWRELVQHLDADQPIYLLQPFEKGGPEHLDLLAAKYLDLIRSVRPHGPYVVGGYCNGGAIAFGVAQQMIAAGDTVSLLVLIEVQARNAAMAPLFPLIRTIERLGIAGRSRQLQLLVSTRDRTKGFLRRWASTKTIRERTAFVGSWIGRAFTRATRRSRKPGMQKPGQEVAQAAKTHGPGTASWHNRYHHYHQIIPGFMPTKYHGRLAVIYGHEGKFLRSTDLAGSWRLVADNLDVHVLPGAHKTVLTQPGLGALLQELIDRSEGQRAG